MWKLCCVQMDAIREILATIFEMVFEERNSTTIFRKNEYVRKDIKMKVKELRDLLKGVPNDVDIEVVDTENHTRPIQLGGRQITITDKGSSMKIWLEL